MRSSTASSTCCGGAAAPAPTKVLLGVMIEVPSLLYELDALLPRVDFVSVGSNDLLQYFFAADRNNTARRRALRCPVGRPAARSRRHRRGRQRHARPLSLCGEMAGRPLEAMALIGLGYRSISMAPASVGPVKSMVLSLDAGELQRWLAETSAPPKATSAPSSSATPRTTASRSDALCSPHDPEAGPQLIFTAARAPQLPSPVRPHRGAAIHSVSEQCRSLPSCSEL